MSTICQEKVTQHVDVMDLMVQIRRLRLRVRFFKISRFIENLVFVQMRKLIL